MSQGTAPLESDTLVREETLEVSMRKQLYRAALVATWVLATAWPTYGERAGDLVEEARLLLQPDGADRRVAELP